MLNETSILPLLKDAENERTERTVSINATEKFGQAICAFANDIMNTGKPGYLFIGADNDGNPSGLHYTDDLQKDLAGIRSEGNILSEPSSFKVIVRSADPLSEQIRTNTEVSKTDLSGLRTNERTNPNKSIEDRLIEIVRVNSTISKTALAHELGIGRTKLYELLGTMTHRVRSTGGTRHVEWTVLED